MTVTTDEHRYTLITAFIRVHLWSQCSAIFFMPKRVIIDTDPGVDDALALILALQSPELQVEAITTVSGNVPVDLATQNALAVLGLLPPGRRPPVAKGADQPLTRPLSTAVHVHGDDGLGGVSRLVSATGQPRYPPASAMLISQDAVTCLLDLIRSSPSELTLIALGPLTNLAHALRCDAHAIRQLAEVVIMGGAAAVPGNVTPVAEFNIYVDPEAAQVVFASGLPITLIGLDVTEQVRMTAEMIDRYVRASHSPLSQFVVECTAQTLQFSSCVERPPGMAMHDPLAVAALIDPALVHTVPLSVQVETKGEFTTGMLVADRRPLHADLQAPTNVNVALEVDAARFLEMFLHRLQTS
jgi:inosine-uridine nucleoside N-ribohydrolase